MIARWGLGRMGRVCPPPAHAVHLPSLEGAI